MPTQVRNHPERIYFQVNLVAVQATDSLFCVTNLKRQQLDAADLLSRDCSGHLLSRMYERLGACWKYALWLG